MNSFENFGDEEVGEPGAFGARRGSSKIKVASTASGLWRPASHRQSAVGGNSPIRKYLRVRNTHPRIENQFSRQAGPGSVTRCG